MSDTEAAPTFKLYKYDPSFIAALAAAALFGITSLLHIWQLSKNKTWYFIPFVIGGLFETVGYVGRIMSSKQESGEWTLMPYIMQSLLILLGPSLLAASIYMVLGRIIRITGGEALSPVRVNWLTKIFVVGDVFSFLMQSSGGGMLAQADSKDKVDLGENIIVGGLIVQILFFSLFGTVAGIFHMRISRHPTTISKSLTVPWQRELMVLYGSSLLILIRSVYRVLEYIQGSDGVLMKTEAYMYVFDAAFIFIAMALFNIWHPSRVTNSAKEYTPFDEESQSIAMQPPSPYNGRNTGY
ncbi:rta1 domain-containing protein [Phlyctema vagabunda]|uniref:Rta1 domain-containing protein n=1 Tax=Phlyctema vagabunda TaxID=108571 RepID=A0ABR4P9S2_9HELO